MDKQTSPVTIECLSHAVAQDIETIQRLLAQLSDRFKTHRIPTSLFEESIASPYHDILIAREVTTDTIVGCATLSITFGTGAGRRAWLDDFVIDAQYQGMGIGNLLWEEMLIWAQRHDATALQFTSSDKHKSAHKFYLKRGAVIRDTNFFKKTIG